MGPVVSHLELTHLFADLTDVTLADEYTNTILTDNDLVGKFVTNASGAIWWPNLKLMQVAPSGGQLCN